MRAVRQIIARLKINENVRRFSVSSRKLLTAFGTATSQNAKATNRAHALAEAMTALSDKLTWLIRSLHSLAPQSGVPDWKIGLRKPHVRRKSGTIGKIPESGFILTAYGQVKHCFQITVLQLSRHRITNG